MFNEWIRQRLKLSQLLIWERVIRTMDLHHPVNASSLQANLREQREVGQAIEMINRHRETGRCLEETDKNQGQLVFCDCGKLLKSKTACVDCNNV